MSKTDALQKLSELEDTGLIDLYLGDASGFWQTPVIARAWQFQGEEIRIVPEKGRRLSVFGFPAKDNQSRLWTSEKSITAQFVVDCIEQGMLAKLSKPRVLVLDNARVNRSRLLESKLAEWETENLYIFFLPTYSPHLNLIETLWRKMKYEWIKAEAYESFEKLTAAVKTILNGIGTEFTIKFKERIFTT